MPHDAGDVQRRTDSGCFSIPEFCRWAGIGRTTAYEEHKTGRLIIVKCGRRSLIRVEDALRWRDTLPGAHDAPHAGDRQLKTPHAKLSTVSTGRCLR